MRYLLFTECLQNDFVAPVHAGAALPNELHIGRAESRRLLGDPEGSYFDPRKVFHGSPESNGMLDEIAPYDELLKERGHFILGQPLSLPGEAITVQVRDGKTLTSDGPFVETKEMLAGFVLLEAHDLSEASPDRRE